MVVAATSVLTLFQLMFSVGHALNLQLETFLRGKPINYTKDQPDDIRLTLSVGRHVHADNLLNCFVVVLPGSYEIPLLRMQYVEKLGVFACDQFLVFSTKPLCQLLGKDRDCAAGELSHAVINKKLVLPRQGGKFQTAMNVDLFMDVWQMISRQDDVQASRFKWLVKFDVDTVVDVPSLRKLVGLIGSDSPGVQALNFFKQFYTKHQQLLGPVEVMSTVAFAKVVRQLSTCYASFGHLNISEDAFLGHCLTMLQVKTATPMKYLDAYWDWTTGHPIKNAEAKVCGEGFVAYHPFKDAHLWRACYNLMRASKFSAGEWIWGHCETGKGTIAASRCTSGERVEDVKISCMRDSSCGGIFFNERWHYCSSKPTSDTDTSCWRPYLEKRAAV